MILQGIGIFGQAALKTLDKHISKIRKHTQKFPSVFEGGGHIIPVK
jgi:hypothetical protein